MADTALSKLKQESLCLVNPFILVQQKKMAHLLIQSNVLITLRSSSKSSPLFKTDTFYLLLVKLVSVKLVF